VIYCTGVVRETQVDTDFDDESDAKRVHILVHDLKPPFLDGRVVFTKQQEMVSVVKDATSDLAVLAKQGSKLLFEVREKNERSKMKNKFWELAGNKIGSVIGVKAVATDEELKEKEKEKREARDGDFDYKESSKFASHIGGKSEAVSAFAQSKTITQQREFLPIFTVREQLLQVIRDHSGTPHICYIHYLYRVIMPSFLCHTLSMMM
jgi:pre-mRNA-splicing factor ATP-dependent RNA helicase DHX38/PRP16